MLEKSSFSVYISKINQAKFNIKIKKENQFITDCLFLEKNIKNLNNLFFQIKISIREKKYKSIICNKVFSKCWKYENNLIQNEYNAIIVNNKVISNTRKDYIFNIKLIYLNNDKESKTQELWTSDKIVEEEYKSNLFNKSLHISEMTMINKCKEYIYEIDNKEKTINMNDIKKYIIENRNYTKSIDQFDKNTKTSKDKVKRSIFSVCIKSIFDDKHEKNVFLKNKLYSKLMKNQYDHVFLRNEWNQGPAIIWKENLNRLY